MAQIAVDANSRIRFQKLFHELVTDYKSQLSQLYEATPEDIIAGNIEKASPTWTAFSSRYKKNAERLTSLHEQKRQALKAEQQTFSNLNESDIDALGSTVNELRAAVKVEIRQEDKPALIVRHPVITLSTVVQMVQERLQNTPSIKQVRFEANHAFYIDTSLEQSVWHGTSIKISAPCIECVASNLHFDLSGNNAAAFLGKANNGKIFGQNGYNGDNGTCGENGGNVELLCDRYQGLNSLSIYTNGGNGSNGQDGGDGCHGQDGKDGRCLTLDEVKANFESPLVLRGLDEENIKNSVKYLRRKTRSMEPPNLRNFNDKGCMTDWSMFANAFTYYKGILDEIEVEYEYCFSKWGTGKSFYVYFKGEKGTPGSCGGKGGLGGAAGMHGNPGTITIHSSTNEVTTENGPKKFQAVGKSGNPGANGKDGKDGKNGTNANDIAIVDFCRWVNPIYYNENKYRFEDLESGPSDSVWCCKNEKYRRLALDNTR